MKANEIILTQKEEKWLSELIEILERNFKPVIQKIQYKLLPMADENEYLINPRLFRDYITEETEAVFTFMKTREINMAGQRGNLAAVNGLDKNIISFLCRALKSFFREHVAEKNLDAFLLALEMIDRYKDAYQDSFIEQFVIEKNKEQDGLYNAQTKTVLRQREEIAEKERQFRQAEIDNLKTIKAVIEAQMHQRTQFLICFAHDTMNLCTAIQTRLLAVKREAGVRKLPSLSLLEDDHNRFFKMFTTILDTEKILQKRNIYKHDTIINVSDITKAKIELFKDIAAENSIKITREIGEDFFTRMSPQAFDRILDNIIGNSIKYTKRDGEIHITVKGNEKSVVLTIKDTGIGIPDDQKENLFKPYYQMTRVKRNNYDGFGIGLFIVKGIVNEVKGEIAIKSRENRGTTVTITFKREASDTIKKDELAEHIILTKPLKPMEYILRPERWEQGKKTILFVEDDLKLLAIMQKELDGEFNYYYAPNGREALKKLATMEKPDIIVSDVVMDPCNGYELLKQLRKMKDMEDIPFIFISAKTAFLEKIKGLRLGAIDYIDKPFNVEIMKEKIKSLVQNRIVYAEKEAREQDERLLNYIRYKRNKNRNKNSYLEQKTYEFNLSRRERETLYYLLQGMDDKAIADIMCVAVNTIQKHIQKIKLKCKVENRIELGNIFRK